MEFTEHELNELLERAAERGAEKAIDKVTGELYQAVGKKVINKLWQAAGMAAIAFCLWAAKHGWFGT